MNLTKEIVTKALREGKVSYTIFNKDGTIQGPTQIPTEPQKIDHRENTLPVLPELPYTRV